MRKKIIEIIGFQIRKELAEIKADEIIKLFKKYNRMDIIIAFALGFMICSIIYTLNLLPTDIFDNLLINLSDIFF